MDNIRRNFIRKSSLSGFSFLTGGLGLVMDPKSAYAGSAGYSKIISNIKGLNIPELKDKYRQALFEKFIPNMDELVVDHEYGGFMCSVDIVNRKTLSTNKRAWFEGRGIWMYSFLYNNFEKNPRYLEIATKSKNFILKLLPEDGSYYTTNFTREGKPIGNVPGDIYGNLFVAEGLAEYSKASGDKQYLNQAIEIILKAVDRYDQADFQYAYKAETRISGPRILGHWMILLSVSTQILKQTTDDRIQALAKRCVDAILNHHITKEYGVLNEALAHDLSPLSDPVASRYGDIGHGCETLAFIMNYAVLTKDKALFKRSSEEFKRHVEIAKDNVFGGHYHAFENIPANTYLLTKVRWLQEEILIGALILIEHTGDEWALKCFAQTEAYIREKFVRSDYAFVIDTGDRKLEKYSTVRAEHYHYPRQLMVSLLAFDRILKRNQKPSGIFL
ncbi:MAG: AGE family epimerase/isomerase [Bacteroidota bacterium]